MALQEEKSRGDSIRSEAALLSKLHSPFCGSHRINVFGNQSWRLKRTSC
jgi:hypothetical protein